MGSNRIQVGADTSLLTSRNRGIYLVPVSLTVAIFGWYLAVQIGGFPPFILPGPELVWARLLRALGDGSLLRHTLVTLQEVVAGLALGVGVATVLGYVLAKSRAVERLLSPYIVASQSVPTVAIAPLLVIWFGPGLISKVLICALIVFFPVLVNIIVGVRSVPEDLRDLMRSLQASRWQTFTLPGDPGCAAGLFGRAANWGDAFGDWCRRGRVCGGGPRPRVLDQPRKMGI